MLNFMLVLTAAGIGALIFTLVVAAFLL